MSNTCQAYEGKKGRASYAVMGAARLCLLCSKPSRVMARQGNYLYLQTLVVHRRSMHVQLCPDISDKRYQSSEEMSEKQKVVLVEFK